MSRHTCGECSHQILDTDRMNRHAFQKEGAPRPLLCRWWDKGVNSDWTECPARARERELLKVLEGAGMIVRAAASGAYINREEAGKCEAKINKAIKAKGKGK